jgi:hypothetical protein
MKKEDKVRMERGGRRKIRIEGGGEEEEKEEEEEGAREGRGKVEIRKNTRKM